MILNFWMIMKMFFCIFFRKKEEGVKGLINGWICGNKMMLCWNWREKSVGFWMNCFSIRNEEKIIKLK